MPEQYAFRKYIEAEQADVVILTEVKYPEAANADELDWLRRHYKVRSLLAKRPTEPSRTYFLPAVPLLVGSGRQGPGRGTQQDRAHLRRPLWIPGLGRE